MVVFFSVTQVRPLPSRSTSIAWEVVDGKRLKITVHLQRDDARVVYMIPVGK